MRAPDYASGNEDGPSGAARAPRLDEVLRAIPRSAGLALLGLGAAGVIIPGPVPLGAPFVLAGLVILAPAVARRWGGWLIRRCPALYCVIRDQARRFAADLQRRYPGSLA